MLSTDRLLHKIGLQTRLQAVPFLQKEEWENCERVDNEAARVEVRNNNLLTNCCFLVGGTSASWWRHHFSEKWVSPKFSPQELLSSIKYLYARLLSKYSWALAQVSDWMKYYGNTSSASTKICQNWYLFSRLFLYFDHKICHYQLGPLGPGRLTRSTGTRLCL